MSENKEFPDFDLGNISDYDDETIDQANKAFFHWEERKYDLARPYLKAACHGRYGYSLANYALLLLDDGTDESNRKAASLILQYYIRKGNEEYDFEEKCPSIKKIEHDLRMNHTNETKAFVLHEYEAIGEYPAPIETAVTVIQKELLK